MTGIIIYVNEAVVSIVIKYKPRTVSLQAPQTDSHDSLVLEPTCLLKRSELGPWVQTHPSHTHTLPVTPRRWPMTRLKPALSMGA